MIGSKLISRITKIFKNNSIKFEKCLLVIDKNIPNKNVKIITKSLKNKKVFKYIFDANERNKNQKSINHIVKILLKQNFSRNDCLISIGGGITGDVSGFAASMFKRGLQFINIPTTLLSQVDSSIGGKTGINTKFGKNLIGSFYQPKIVISDTEFLRSLPRREIICGYGEILKHSLILNKNLFKYLNNNLLKILNLKSPYLEKAILESCKIKKIVVEKDEKENNIRKILNFGHTFAHAYEATLNYSKKLNHGEAVILGMKTALGFSLKNDLIHKNEYDSVINHIKNLNFKTNLSNYISIKDLDKVLQFMEKDKKNKSKKINLILLKSIGSASIENYLNKDKIKIFLKNELING